MRFWIHVRFSTAKKKKKKFWRFLIISRGMWDSNPFAAHKDVSRKTKNTTVKQENQERNENSWNNITDTSKSIPEHWRVDHWPQHCVYLRVSITQTIQRLNDNSPGGINRQTHSTNKFKQKHCLGLSCDSYRREEKNQLNRVPSQQFNRSSYGWVQMWPQVPPSSSTQVQAEYDFQGGFWHLNRGIMS